LLPTVRELSPSSSPGPQSADWTKLGHLSRRRPLSSTGAGGVEVLRLAPARLTQSSTSLEVEDWEAVRVYFFFRRLVFFAPFFAADFVFVFRFFAMLPS
jgi:hypothetical protein